MAQPRGKDWNQIVQESHDNWTYKITVSGSITYVGKAKIGTAQSTAQWQAMKVDETTGTIVTWANGNDNFENIATDLTVLTYS